MSGNREEQQELRSHITDSKELTEARRIRALLERRERVIDSLEAVSMAQVQGETEASESRLVFVSHLRSLILDLYPLLVQNDKLGDESIGTFHVEPPDDVPINARSHKLRAGADAPSEQTFTIESLEWFVNKTFPQTAAWTIHYADSRGEQTVEKEFVPPTRLCVSALTRTMECMAELKIDIEAHEEQGTYGFDYEELESLESMGETDGS